MATIGILMTWGYNFYWDLAYEIGKAALDKGHKVKYFLFLDGVYSAIKYQEFPDWEKQPKDKLAELIRKGAEVVACGICVDARGLKEGKDFIEKVRVGGLPDFANMVGEVDRLICL